MIQNLVVTRGQKFKEVFNLLKPDGTPTTGRGYDFSIVVFRKEFVREFPLNNRGSFLELNLSAEQTSDFDSNTLSYRIVLSNTREVIAHGMLRVQ
jgi:hypothetical protein